MRDHGGNLDQAMARFGGGRADWIDLSTGINPRPYPVPPLPAHAWAALPTQADLAALTDAARNAYGTTAGLLPVAGAQAAIQMLPRLGPPGRARVLAPTYNEHAASLRASGWQVTEVAEVEALSGADMAVLVNPNNPDGRQFQPERLTALAATVGRLVVDESFADPHPELSLTEPPANTAVLRSFGKFYGLAGLRLGFVLAAEETLAPLRSLAGPWPVSGPAIALGQQALTDRAWQAATTARLARDTARLDALAQDAGWRIVGGTTLFRLYDTPDAAAARDRLARAHIWSRIFPWSTRWLRLGLPDGDAAWTRLATAL